MFWLIGLLVICLRTFLKSSVQNKEIHLIYIYIFFFFFFFLSLFFNLRNDRLLSQHAPSLMEIAVFGFTCVFFVSLAFFFSHLRFLGLTCVFLVSLAFFFVSLTFFFCLTCVFFGLTCGVFFFWSHLRVFFFV